MLNIYKLRNILSIYILKKICICILKNKLGIWIIKSIKTWIFFFWRWHPWAQNCSNILQSAQFNYCELSVHKP